jgi:ElaB/YqjD/DUF883 family membrane-anchored ribosome-binding protein
MELYYKDLISEEASLEKLVDDLMFEVQGANELPGSGGSLLDPRRKHEILTRLELLKQSCLRMRAHAAATARATDKMLRQSPYASVGLAFGVGLLVGLLLRRNDD